MLLRGSFNGLRATSLQVSNQFYIKGSVLLRITRQAAHKGDPPMMTLLDLSPVLEVELTTKPAPLSSFPPNTQPIASWLSATRGCEIN